MFYQYEGVASATHVPVLTNVYHIPERFKELDEHLFVMLNRSTGNFEIHDDRQLGGSLACVLPYSELDARALTYVAERMNQELEELVRRIDAENEKLEQQRYASIIDKAQYKTKEAFRYLDMNTHTDSLPKELINE